MHHECHWRCRVQAECLTVEAGEGDLRSHGSHVASRNLPVWRCLHVPVGAIAEEVQIAAHTESTGWSVACFHCFYCERELLTSWASK